jgi:transposase
MLRMDQVYVVRHKALVEGQSIRSIAREMGVGRNTIKKYLQVSEPVRVEHQRKPSPITEEVAPHVTVVES